MTGHFHFFYCHLTHGLIIYALTKRQKGEMHNGGTKEIQILQNAKPLLTSVIALERDKPVEGMTEKVSGSIRLVWLYTCYDELR